MIPSGLMSKKETQYYLPTLNRGVLASSAKEALAKVKKPRSNKKTARKADRSKKNA